MNNQQSPLRSSERYSFIKLVWMPDHSDPFQRVMEKSWDTSVSNLLHVSKVQRKHDSLMTELDQFFALPEDSIISIMTEVFFDLGLIEAKRCSECSNVKLPRYFPSKGGGRVESCCKKCFNSARRARRQSKSGGRVEPLVSCRVSVSDRPSQDDWRKTIVHILTSRFTADELGADRVAALIDGGTTAIKELLEKSGV